MKLVFLTIVLFLPFAVLAQSIRIVDTTVQESFRGLSVVNEKILWVSGTNGTIGRSTDGGVKWKWVKVKGFENIDFRDIEAFGRKKAVIMGVGSPAYILRTQDGGKTWRVVYENKDSTMFLDAMEFWNDDSGIVLGDPSEGYFFVARTFDGGKSWKELPAEKKPKADEGEICFAASGTNIVKMNLNEAIFVSGGTVSNLFYRDKKIKIPMSQGAPTKGANSLDIKNGNTIIIVGGDFIEPGNRMGNCAISPDKGKTWDIPSVAPGGYRSGVAYANDDNWITCGPNGVDFSSDDGQT